jgi:hypothetical protein
VLARVLQSWHRDPGYPSVVSFGGTVSQVTEEWIRSSFCDTGACLEIASAGGDVLVRDSKSPEQAHLRLGARAWTEFLDGVIAGDFDFR